MSERDVPQEINSTILGAFGISVDFCAKAVITLLPGRLPSVTCEYYAHPFRRDELGELVKSIKTFDLHPRERT